MLVSEILAIKGKVLFTISPNKHVAEAVEIMNEQDVGSLVVFSRGEMVGMLTFREVLQGVQRTGSGWQTLAIDDVMIRNPQVASRLIEPLIRLKRYDEKRQAKMRAALEQLKGLENLSGDLYEKIAKALA